MALAPAAGAATWRCCGHFTRPFSQATRRGARPGGEELGRLLLDDLGSVPRPAGGLELLFGLSPCLLALRAARRRVARLLIQAGRSGLEGQRAELLRAAEARTIPVLRPRRRELDVLCRHQVHQGVCMEVSPLRPRPWAEAEAEKARPGDDPQQLWLVLEGLQDPRNLGAVLRSAHFLGVDKVITSRRNSCPLTPVVSKASAGAMEVMDVFSTDDLAGFLQSQRLPSHWPLGCSLFVTLAWPEPGRAGSWLARWAARGLRSPRPPRSPSLAAWSSYGTGRPSSCWGTRALVFPGKCRPPASFSSPSCPAGSCLLDSSP
ncbi:rRNA methyltransferase 1, mitochondrial isoform X2 [Odocoileus virginianus]|uniref:rRNA methyltransferase 1, mitochondrial n=1 Tax=Odocoileus virginianus TaxID=9874 RepID=A0ABM4J3S0_ODOVR